MQKMKAKGGHLPFSLKHKKREGKKKKKAQAARDLRAFIRRSVKRILPTPRKKKRSEVAILYPGSQIRRHLESHVFFLCTY
jgi:hypothetical protein